MSGREHVRLELELMFFLRIRFGVCLLMCHRRTVSGSR